MKLRRIARFLKERLQLLAGRVPSCRWVRQRLGAYHHWDSALSRAQFDAIEMHLSECPECRAEWQKTSELCHNLERLRRRMAGEPSIDGQVACLMGRINENRAKQAGCGARWEPWLIRYNLKLVTACLFTLLMPILGYLGHHALTKYFGLGQTMTEKQFLVMPFGSPAKAIASVEMVVAVCLLLIALLLLGYIACCAFKPKQCHSSSAFCKNLETVESKESSGQLANIKSSEKKVDKGAIK